MHRFSAYILTLGLPLLIGGSTDVMMGKGRMQSGDIHLATDAFERAVRERPESGRAKVALAQALALQGQCTEALELLKVVRGGRAWNLDAAMNEAICSYRIGDEATYLAALEEGVVLKPRDANAWFQVGIGLLRLGDVSGARDAVRTLESLPEHELLALMLEASIALETGAADADFLIHQFIYQTRHIPALVVQGLILDARRWLLLGDPSEADRVIERAILMDLRNVAAAAWRAEAYRRAGQPDSGWVAMQRPAVVDADSPLRDAIRIRVLVDLGKMEEARSALTKLAGPFSKEGLASRWYLAVASGDLAEANQARELWSLVNLDPNDRLDSLHPKKSEKP